MTKTTIITARVQRPQMLVQPTGLPRIKIFLLTRWRQADAFVSFVNEEIHYYLID